MSPLELVAAVVGVLTMVACVAAAVVITTPLDRESAPRCRHAPHNTHAARGKEPGAN